MKTRSTRSAVSWIAHVHEDHLFKIRRRNHSLHRRHARSHGAFIDEQFSRNLDARKSADIQLILDGRKSNTTQILANYAGSIIQQYNEDYATKIRFQLQNTDLIIRNWFNPNLIYYWYNIPSLSGVLTMLVGLVVTALSVARERELGTFDQLLVSPPTANRNSHRKDHSSHYHRHVRRNHHHLCRRLYPSGSLHRILAFANFSMFVFITSIVGVGLFISSISQTQQQALLGTYVFMSPSVLLSGFATPIENMPVWLQPLTFLIPLRYFLVIAKGLFLKAMPLDTVLSNTWPMAVLAVFTLAGAGWFFSKRLE